MCVVDDFPSLSDFFFSLRRGVPGAEEAAVRRGSSIASSSSVVLSSLDDAPVEYQYDDRSRRFSWPKRGFLRF